MTSDEKHAGRAAKGRRGTAPVLRGVFTVRSGGRGRIEPYDLFDAVFPRKGISGTSTVSRDGPRWTTTPWPPSTPPKHNLPPGPLANESTVAAAGSSPALTWQN